MALKITCHFGEAHAWTKQWTINTHKVPLVSIPNSAGRIVRLLDQGMLCAAEGQNVAALVRIIALQRSQYNIPACAKQWHLETTREEQQQKKDYQSILLSSTKNNSTMDNSI